VPPVEQLADLLEVPRGYGADQGHLVRQLVERLQRLALLLGPVLHRVAADQLKQLGHIGSHRRLDPGPVALELVDHHLPNKQIQPPIEREQVQGDDQSLAVSPLIPAIQRL
jgi:hypothetical protein